MAFASQTAGVLILAGALWGQPYQFAARHEHLRKGCAGQMTVDPNGIAFHGAGKHVWNWKYQDIQELKLTPRGLRLVTYQDSRLRLGADRQYEFRGAVPKELYGFWTERLDQRFVAELADAPAAPLWSVPAKHLRRMVGSHGVLEVGADRVVYATDDKEDARTWRLADIENISTSGRFDLTITTAEKAFHFQLKQPLDEAGYNQLWRQINLKEGKIQ